MSKEKSIEATEVFSILSATINGANFDDLCDTAHRIVHIAGYHKQKEGKWIKRGNEKKCSHCEFIYYSNNDDWSYCPNCGARMKGGTE